MSFFYLNPVKGDMSLHLLETVLMKRLEYFKGLLRQSDMNFNEYVVEGSVYDNVGHFMVCIVSIMSQNTEFTQFIMKAEFELFKKRLAPLTAYDMRCFAKKLLRNIKKLEHTPEYINPLTKLCQHMMIKDLAHHIICTFHNTNCDQYKIKLHFKHCLKLIAKRELEVQNGTALLPCGKWKQYLVSLFCDNLQYRLDKTNIVMLKSDPRLNGLLHKISHNFFPEIRKESTLLSKEVDNESKYFPPCMLNLHLSLRRKHRLYHSQRFYYSLFLKDIGMPVEEAVLFWRSEYRQNLNGTHSCCHNWDRDEKKYLYGIRHMYGLEGGRKNYTSVNCQRIQSIENACTEGGCPFKSFDSNNMLPLLKNPSGELLSQISERKRLSQYTSACILYLKTLNNSFDCDNFSFNFTPVKYYNIASKIVPR